MDRLIYIAMTGAHQVMAQQATTAHNLANLSTTGFRAQLDSFRAVPVQGPSLPTRAFVVDATTGTDAAPGLIQETGRALDVALTGPGWLVLQAAGGSEVLTRNGNFNTNDSGVLVGQGGMAVAGDAGTITVPADAQVTIAPDGSISSLDARGVVTTLGRLRLLNPSQQEIERGDDGLFRLVSGVTAQADGRVRVAAGRLEGSNVNAVDAMVSLISQARSFELQMSLLKNAESNEAKASQIVALN